MRHWLDADPPEWLWPWPCHEYGHVWTFGRERCFNCGFPHWIAHEFKLAL